MYNLHRHPVGLASTVQAKRLPSTNGTVSSPSKPTVSCRAFGRRGSHPNPKCVKNNVQRRRPVNCYYVISCIWVCMHACVSTSMSVCKQLHT